jgi:hypothetical protein
LPPEKSFPTLDRFAFILPDSNHQDLPHRFYQNLHWWIAVAGHVLDLGSQLVTVAHPNNRSIITYSKEDFATSAVREGDQFSDERR